MENLENTSSLFGSAIAFMHFSNERSFFKSSCQLFSRFLQEFHETLVHSFSMVFVTCLLVLLLFYYIMFL